MKLHKTNIMYFAVILISTVILSCKEKADRNTSVVIETTETISSQKTLSDSIHGAYLLLDKTRADFGRICRTEAPYISIQFEVQNMGKEPLVIIKGDVSCANM